MNSLNINRFSRYQKEFKFHEMCPNKDPGICACGCGEKLHGRQTRWAGADHAKKLYDEYALIKGDGGVIRRKVFERDHGVCCGCGLVCEYPLVWHADHILPVYKGGGACGLDNFQTLCEDCHKEKTREDMKIARG